MSSPNSSGKVSTPHAGRMSLDVPSVTSRSSTEETIKESELQNPEPPSIAECIEKPRDNGVPLLTHLGDDNTSKENVGTARKSTSVNAAASPNKAGRRPPNAPLATNLSRTQSRLEGIISRVRSRPEPVFTHPLSYIKTSPANIVDFDGPNDPYHPLNWDLRRKAVTTLIYSSITMSASWASSSYSSGTHQVAAEFHVGAQTATLGTTLFLLGFGVGPLLWAPLGEVYGRKMAVMIPMFIAACFSFATAVSKDLQSIMINRFFGGFFASAPVTNTGGVLGDLFSPAERGIAMAAYATAVVAGPALGPIVSSAVVETPSLGWRWTEYITGILQSVILLAGLVFVDESYPPKLLVTKARHLRYETGNWALHTEFEEWDISIKQLARKFLVRPIQLLTTPICFLLALYASFCYGIIYMQLGGIPIIFGEARGWNTLQASLPFVCILLGSVLGAAVNVYNQVLYNKAYHAAGDIAIPEKRLPPMMIGSILFAGGLFLTGWTAGPGVHWIVPCIGITVVGFGFITVFQAALNYLVDTFTLYAASAVAANTFLRSCLAASFPIAVAPLYHNLGIGPGSSIMAGFASLLIPVPLIFYIFGERIRAGSRWSKSSVKGR